jgi:hypothetical protein
MHFVKHPVLPLVASSDSILACIVNLESISIVSVFHEVLEVAVGPHMDDDGSIIGDIVV